MVITANKLMICRPYITVKGRRLYARDYGKKAFCFLGSPYYKGIKKRKRPS